MQQSNFLVSSSVQNGNMISNERPSPWGRRPQSLPKTPVREDVLKTEQIQIESKTIVCTLKESPRGRFLRISEEGGGHRNSVIIPATGLEELRKTLDGMIQTAHDLPAKSAAMA